MKQNVHFLKKGGRSIGISVLIGVAMALAVSGLLSVGLTSLLMNGHVELNGTVIIVFLIRALSVLAGGLLASALSEGKHLAVIGLVAVGYLLILLGLGIVLYDGSFRNFGGGVLSAAAGGASACLIKLKPPAKRKHSFRYAK